MPNVKSRKIYTRRNTRTRLIDLLKEAIELVEKGCPAGVMTRAPSLQTQMPATRLNTIAEEPLVTQAKTLLATSQVELNKGRKLQAEAEKFMNVHGIPKSKGAARPGVLKYNEFVKKWISEHPEYQAKGQYQAALKQIQSSGAWAAVTKGNNGTRKIKTPAVTPGRLSPPMRNLVANNLSTASRSLPVNAATATTTPTIASLLPGVATETPPTETPSTETPSTETPSTETPSTATPLAYQNEGMDDTVGMRRIKMNGRNLYISSNNGIFNRQGNSPGDFVGRLVNGKIVEEEAPELPEYA